METTPTHLQNSVLHEFISWVNDTVLEYKHIKLLVPCKEWEDEKPTLLLSLGVKPETFRVLWDTRFLNLFLKHCLFSLNSIYKVPTVAWEGMYLFQLSRPQKWHLHVPFHWGLWTFLGV